MTRCPAACPTCGHRCEAMTIGHANHYDEAHTWPEEDPT